MSDHQPDDAIVGTWRLVSWENRDADGQVTHPMGSDPIGYLFYSRDGHFSVTISRTGRRPFPADDLLGGALEDKARAVEGFVSYAGSYTYDGDRVVHHVELSLFPNWVGSDQERTVELVGSRLTLSAAPLPLAGKHQVPRLVWQRVEPA